MLRFLPLALALAAAVSASDPMQALIRQQQMNAAMSRDFEPPLIKMQVYLKDGNTQPPLDSFRLYGEGAALWRYEHEEAFFKKGEKVRYRLDQLDSVVTRNGFTGIPHGTSLLFAQGGKAIRFYSHSPDSIEGLPPLIQKGGGEILRAKTRNIRDMVVDDPEALDMITRYSQRWAWRGGIMAAGAALVGAGLGIAVATEEKDVNGKHKPTTPLAAALIFPGMACIVVPVTPILNFIWNPLPKRALDTYNRNHQAVP